MGQKKTKHTENQAARRYAESLICPVCGNPVRVRQRICHYCKSDIRKENMYLKGNNRRYG